jgi:trans-aconitate methyltransferase
MSETLADWLAVREPADVAARSAWLTESLVRHLGSNRPLRVLELGTGTGSNIRYLAPRLGGAQEWLAVDRDPELLAILPLRLTFWATDHGLTAISRDDDLVVSGPGLECRVRTRQADLNELTPALFADRRLVTASALLDLVSETWLRKLADLCAGAGAAALFTLTYTGESSCTPVEAEDDWIRDLLNRHQNRDKGLGGPAAGPGATDAAVTAFSEKGYDVHAAASPWKLDASASELQRQLIEGWARAAGEVMPDDAAAIDAWRLRRLAHLHAGHSRIVVHHFDVLALPAGARDIVTA